MEVYTTKGVMIMYPLALFAIMLILLNGYCCAAAAVLVKSNTTFRCDGRLDECLLIQDDLELEFLINPYVSRVLTVTGANPQPKSPGALISGGTPFPPCPPNYCVSKPEKPKPTGCKNVFACKG